MMMMMMMMMMHILYNTNQEQYTKTLMKYEWIKYETHALNFAPCEERFGTNNKGRGINEYL